MTIKAMELVSKMEAQLPIPARSTTALERLTLHVSRSHPLGQEIRTYQEDRKRGLVLQGGLCGPTSFTAAPRKKH